MPLRVSGGVDVEALERDVVAPFKAYLASHYPEVMAKLRVEIVTKERGAELVFESRRPGARRKTVVDPCYWPAATCYPCSSWPSPSRISRGSSS